MVNAPLFCHDIDSIALPRFGPEEVRLGNINIWARGGMVTRTDYERTKKPALGFRPSLGFCGVVSIQPFFPTASEHIDLRKPFLQQFLCHPGTGSFRGSGSVQNEGIILRIFVNPRRDILGFFPDGALDLRMALSPVTGGAYIQDDQIGFPEHCLEIIF
jgi:hypothetical protein